MEAPRLDFKLEPKRFRLLFRLLAALALLLIWLVYLGSEYFIRHNLEQGLEQRVQRDALLLEDHGSRALDTVVSRLKAVATFSGPTVLRAGGLSSGMLRDLILDNPVLRSLSLLDPQGRVIASSEPGNLGVRLPASLLPDLGRRHADREVSFGRVLPHRDLGDLVRQEPAPGLSLWLASTTVSEAGRQFRWVAVINTDYFLNFWSRYDPQQHDQLGLYDYEGRLLFAQSRAELQPQEADTLSRLLGQQLRARDLGWFLFGPQQRWLLAYRGSTAHPVALAIVADRDRLGQQDTDRTERLLLALLSTLLVLVLSIWLYRWYLRYEASVAELANQARAIGAHVMAAESDPDGKILVINQALLDKTGYPEDELIGQNLRLLGAGLQPAEFHDQICATVRSGQIWKGLLHNQGKTGASFWVNATVVPFTDAWGRITRIVSLYTDVSDAIGLAQQLADERRLRAELARLNEKLTTHANTDPLTGLYNRRGFDSFAQQALLASCHYARPLSALMLDLDHFKQINDGHGHAVGDLVLRDMAHRWSSLLRSSDLLARLGGEEFCVLLPNTHPHGARQVAEKLRAATECMAIDARAVGGPAELAVTVSIGVASCEQTPGLSLPHLLDLADRALYDAKHGGRNRIVSRLLIPAT